MLYYIDACESVKSEIVWRLLLGHYCCVVNGGIRRDPTIGAQALPRWVDVFYSFSLMQCSKKSMNCSRKHRRHKYFLETFSENKINSRHQKMKNFLQCVRLTGRFTTVALPRKHFTFSA